VLGGKSLKPFFFSGVTSATTTGAATSTTFGLASGFFSGFLSFFLSDLSDFLDTAVELETKLLFNSSTFFGASSTISTLAGF